MWPKPDDIITILGSTLDNFLIDIVSAFPIKKVVPRHYESF